MTIKMCEKLKKKNFFKYNFPFECVQSYFIIFSCIDTKIPLTGLFIVANLYSYSVMVYSVYGRHLIREWINILNNIFFIYGSKLVEWNDNFCLFLDGLFLTHKKNTFMVLWNNKFIGGSKDEFVNTIKKDLFLKKITSLTRNFIKDFYDLYKSQSSSIKTKKKTIWWPPNIHFYTSFLS